MIYLFLFIFPRTRIALTYYRRITLKSLLHYWYDMMKYIQLQIIQLQDATIHHDHYQLQSIFRIWYKYIRTNHKVLQYKQSIQQAIQYNELRLYKYIYQQWKLSKIKSQQLKLTITNLKTWYYNIIIKRIYWKWKLLYHARINSQQQVGIDIDRENDSSHHLYFYLFVF